MAKKRAQPRQPPRRVQHPPPPGPVRAALLSQLGPSQQQIRDLRGTAQVLLDRVRVLEVNLEYLALHLQYAKWSRPAPPPRLSGPASSPRPRRRRSRPSR